MFHRSESIIITSKSQDKTDHHHGSHLSDHHHQKPRSLLGRQRASTWSSSSPTFKEAESNTNNNTNNTIINSNSNSPSGGMGGMGGMGSGIGSGGGGGGENTNIEKRKFRARFGSLRPSNKGGGATAATTTGNSGATNNLNSAVPAVAIVSAMHTPRFPISLQQFNTTTTATTASKSSPTSPRHHHSVSIDTHLTTNSSSIIDDQQIFREGGGREAPEISVASPPRVTGVSKEGLVHWLNLNPPSPDPNGGDMDLSLVLNADNANNTGHNTGHSNRSIYYDSVSNFETPTVVPFDSDASDGSSRDDTTDINNRNDNMRSFVTSANSYDSPTLISCTSPSDTTTGLQDINNNNNNNNNIDRVVYPPNCKNISYERIGMSEEEEKRSFDYDDEQPFMPVLTDSNTTKNNSDVFTFVGLPSTTSTTTNNNNIESQSPNKTTDGGIMTQSLNIILSDYSDDSDRDSGASNIQSQWDYPPSDTSTHTHNKYKQHSFRTNRFLYFFKKPSWERVSSAVVRHAPCFWCCATVEISNTDRIILKKLNILCAIFALYQVLVGVAYCVITLSKQKGDDEKKKGGSGNEVREGNIYVQALTPNLWWPYTFIPLVAIIGFILFVTVISNVRAIRRVNLQGALRYMWALYWILPLQVLFAVAFLDIHTITDVSIEHLWSTRSMAGFRSFLCESDQECVCAVPLLGDGGNIDLDWCLETCDSPCGDHRETAVAKMIALSHILFIANAIVGLVLAALLMLALFLLQRIISEPIVKSSKESNIPLWLTFPTISSFLGGIYFMSQSGLKNASVEESNQVSKQVINHWIIGVCYIISGSAFLVSALLGWFIAATSVLDNREKRRKKIAVYLFIATMVLTIFAVAAILSYSLIDSTNIVNIGLTDVQRGHTACSLDVFGSCTNCNITQSNETLIEDLPQCPEWNEQEVQKLTQTQMKQSSTLAAIFIAYAFTALRFGFTLKGLVSRYEVDYV